jgi:hypothetical protein
MASDASVFKFYHYDPSLAAAIIFVLAFFATTALHSWQLFRTRSWFMIPLVLGGYCKHSNRTVNPNHLTTTILVEWIGYVGRAISSNQSPNWTLGPYLIQTLLVLVAPALFAASIYMVFGRIILLVDGEEHSIIKKRWLTKIFVCGDIISFIMQGAGTYITSSLCPGIFNCH